MGSSVRCTGNVHIGSTPTLAHKFCYIGFGFRKSPLPHNDASRSACPVTAHITPDVEKVSSYSLPLRTPPSLSSTLLQSTLPIPDSLLPSISLDIPSRERSTDCVCASPNPSPIIEYIRQVLPSPSPPLLLFSCVACRMPRRCPFTFVVKPHSTYAHMLLSLPILLSSFPLYLPSTLRMQCHISFVTSPNYPFVFCNHKFFSLSHCIRLSFPYLATIFSIGMG